jgi:hypothetical protein
MRASILLVASLATLTGCPTVDFGETPVGVGQCRPDRDYFRDEIWPNYLAPTEPERSCVGQALCHAADTGRSALRLETDTSDPGVFDRNYEAVTRFLNCGSPEASPLLTKPMAGLDAHRGGDMFSGTDPEVDVFELWFE